MEKIIHRFVAYLKFKKIALSKADATLKAGNGYIGKQLKNKGSINSDVLEVILKHYKDLNPIWLLLAEGKMILNEDELCVMFFRDDKLHYLYSTIDSLNSNSLVSEVQESYKRNRGGEPVSVEKLEGIIDELQQMKRSLLKK